MPRKVNHHALLDSLAATLHSLVMVFANLQSGEEIVAMLEKARQTA